jgi:hypothetical protein
MAELIHAKRGLFTPKEVYILSTKTQAFLFPLPTALSPFQLSIAALWFLLFNLHKQSRNNHDPPTQKH